MARHQGAHPHQLETRVHTWLAAASAAHEGGVAWDDLRQASVGARALHATSAFVARLQTWPKGYQGDFETVELMASPSIPEGQGVGSQLERFALHAPIIQQHRHVLEAMAARITAVAARPGRSRILVLGSGSGLEVEGALDALAASEAEVLLVDQDPDALRVAARRLAELGNRAASVAADVTVASARVRERGPFDLVIASGLFDALSDEEAHRVLELVVREWVAPGGRLSFSQLDRGHAWQPWLELATAWRLEGRSEDELRALVADSFGPDVQVSFQLEPTGLARIVDIKTAS